MSWERASSATSARDGSRRSIHSRLTASTKPIQPRTASRSIGPRDARLPQPLQHADRQRLADAVDDRPHLGVAPDPPAHQRDEATRVVLDVAEVGVDPGRQPVAGGSRAAGSTAASRSSAARRRPAT